MSESASALSTAAIADASIRLGIAVRTGPTSLRPLVPGTRFEGPARPVTHLGSVDVLLETIDDAAKGSVMVIDNGGRNDEACVGDLMVLEAKLAGFTGMVVWGRHRDTAQLLQIGLPLHSRGAFSFGPRRVPPAGRRMQTAYLDGAAISEDDYVVADDDGILFLEGSRRDELFAAARTIQDNETAQSERMKSGSSLRAQLDFAGYRARQAVDATITLRRHLVERGNSIEV